MSLEFWTTFLDRLRVPIDDPGSRLFHWNILVAFAISGIWFFWMGKGDSKAFLKLIFRTSYWWNRSTKVDYQFWIFNSLLKAALFIPLLDISFYIASFISNSLFQLAGDNLRLTATQPRLFVFTLGVFVFDDLLRFLQHLCMHQFPFLWKIHSAHHSAKILTPVTLYRNHPLESAIATLRNSLSLGAAAGFFVFLFDSTLSLWTLAGVNVFGFLFNLLGANLRHSHIPIQFGPIVESIFISPRQHQIHHSSQAEHQNKNFGVSLAIWDKLLGSWLPGSTDSGSTLRFGITIRQSSNFLGELKKPFI